MASASAGDLGRDLGRLFGAGSAVGLTDGELLERFADRRDESAEAAFETILARHGGMVLTVCRQVLGDVHAAEDAFQATDDIKAGINPTRQTNPSTGGLPLFDAGGMETSSKRPWWTYLRLSLRALIALILAIGAGLGWLAHSIRSAQLQRDAVAAIQKAGGWVGYDWAWRDGKGSVHANVPNPNASARPRAPKWLVDRLGDDYFGHVVLAIVPSTASDAVLQQIGCLSRLEILNFSGSPVTNAGVAHLGGLTRLKALNLSRTMVNDGGLVHLEVLSDLQDLTPGSHR